jgi:hypothetical protein
MDFLTAALLRLMAAAYLPHADPARWPAQLIAAKVFAGAGKDGRSGAE